MSISVYKIRDLVLAFKAQIRSAIASVGTEDKTDHGMMANVAAYMFQTAQVASVYVYEQLFAATADASNRDRMVDYHGLDFTREATKACGLIILHGPAVAATIPAGTTIAFPAASFPDGVARSYVTTEAAFFTAGTWSGKTVVTKSTEWKVRIDGVGGPLGMVAKDVYSIDGATDWVNAIRRVNFDDGSIDPYLPHYKQPVSTKTVGVYAYSAVVAAECTVAGKAGNACSARATFSGLSYTEARILEMSGGGDAVTAIDTDERVIRILEETEAGQPSLGNAQHLRELVLSCPLVDLDDAIVYSHVRGPGTVDVVAVGRSGRLVNTTYPDMRNDFFLCPWNGRRIGEEAAKKVEAWINEKDADGGALRVSYFDDIKVRSVEYDYAGETYDIWDSESLFRSATALTINIDYLPGYGPDNGTDASYVPYAQHDTNLYPASAPAFISSDFKVGDRVWIKFEPPDGRLPFVTVVTKILAIPLSRSYAVVSSMTSIMTGTLLDGTSGAIVTAWGAAGPLTQPVIDATFDYFDQLGPGGYRVVPHGPGYQRAFNTSAELYLAPGVALTRWPPEGRRWSGGFRLAELNARLMAIKGLRSWTVEAANGEATNDIDPQPMYTLALRGVVPVYQAGA